jgi:HK97 family phage prohead protease
VAQPVSILRVADVTGVTSGPDSWLTMVGHCAVFNEWAEIRSTHEGHFMERVAPGAFRNSLARGDRVVCLFSHGHDAIAGNRPIGKILDLREDGKGLAYQVALFNTSFNRDLAPALETGTLGASFRFSTEAMDENPRPGASDYNVRGIPERTIRSVKLAEFGPTTFGAYAGATAGLISDTRSVASDYDYRSIAMADAAASAAGVVPPSRAADRRGRVLTRTPVSGKPAPSWYLTGSLRLQED